MHSFFVPKVVQTKPKKTVPSEEATAVATKQQMDDNVLHGSRPEVMAAVQSNKQGTNDPAYQWVTWESGKPVPYQVLAAAFEKVGATSKRLEITEIMTQVFRAVIVGTPTDLLPAVYLSINKIAPEYMGMELGIGESILINSIAEACGSSAKVIKEKYQAVGDLGVVAAGNRSNQKQLFKPKPLTLPQVFRELKLIAQTSGNKSQNEKKKIICKLLSSSTAVEARFIIASMQGKLRIGLAEQTVLVALAQAVALSGIAGADNRALRGDRHQKALQDAENVVKMAFSEKPSYDVLVSELLNRGCKDLLTHVFLTPGIPTKPMLAKPTKGISEVLDRFSDVDFVCEYKYDGERAQVHLLEDGTIKIYSRNLEDHTPKYPDIVDFLPKCVKPGVKSFVIDCEAVAFDRENNKILPFQQIQGRARKGVALDDIKCNVCLFAFDILFLDGKPLLREDLETRRAALREAFIEVPGMFAWTQSATKAQLGGVEEIQEYLNESVNGMCEGLMVKTLSKDASYEPSRRTFNWLKIKKDYLAGCTDSFDLVPIAGYMGRGKRTGVYGAYLLASYDEESESWQAITKCGTGFSDEVLKTHTAFFNDHKVDSQPSYYQFSSESNSAQEPDQWFEPCQVWEIMAADLSISPVYQSACGLVDPDKGIALRFPRFMRIRDDKTPEHATNSEQVAEMYNNQSFIAGNKADQENEDEY